MSTVAGPGASTTPSRRREVPRGAAPSRGRSRRRRSQQARRDALAASLFLAPVIVSLLTMRIWPALVSIRDAVYSGLPGSVKPPKFVGLANFEELFTNASFWNSIRQTLLFNIIVNPLQILAALALAYLLTRRVAGAGTWRTVIFLPVAIPMIGSTIVWGIALRPEGPINGVIEAMGGRAQPFLTSPTQVLWCFVLIASWIGIGYWMIFLIAGMRDIPTMYYEAATVDGAGAIRQFISITLPLLKRPLLFVLVADTVANFVFFAPIQVLTNGGPEEASNLIMFDIFRRAYQLSDPYLAAAELLVLLSIMLLIVLLQFRLLKEDD